MFINKNTIFALEGIYLTNNNNKTNKQTKQKQERNKKKRAEQDSNPAPCQKLYEHKVNVLKTTDKLFLSVFTVICWENFFLASEDFDFACVMIRDVGEDPLSPALRDIEREREREKERERERPELH